MNNEKAYKVKYDIIKNLNTMREKVEQKRRNGTDINLYDNLDDLLLDILRKLAVENKVKILNDINEMVKLRISEIRAMR